ncbi:MAG: PH domain-containing protein [Pseudomonadota bacterium]
MSQTFQNPPVAPETLPTVADIDWQRLAGRYIGQVIIERLLLFALAGIGFTILVASGRLPPDRVALASAILVIVFVAMLLHAVLAARRKAYAVRQHDVLFRSGLFFRTVTAVPLNRIQHVELHRGPLERGFKLATLQVFTAGGSGSDLSVPGLNEARGAQLREYILGQIGHES